MEITGSDCMVLNQKGSPWTGKMPTSGSDNLGLQPSGENCLSREAAQVQDRHVSRLSAMKLSESVRASSHKVEILCHKPGLVLSRTIFTKLPPEHM